MCPMTHPCLRDYPVPDVCQPTWRYKDEQGRAQGPYSGPQMRKWYLDGYFEASTLTHRCGVDSGGATPSFQKLSSRFSKPLATTAFCD